MSVKLSPLSTEQAIRDWPVLASFLEKAIGSTAGRVTLEDVYQDVTRGGAMVLVVWDPEARRIYAVCCAEAFSYPKRRVFSLTLLGGRDLGQWSHLWPAFCQVARDKGFDQIEVSGRPGWKRFLPGAVEISRTYAMDLQTSAHREVHGRQEEQDEDHAA